MIRFFNLKTFLLSFVGFSALGLIIQAGGCSDLASEGVFKLTRGNGIFVPVSKYTDGQTCDNPLLYFLNVPWHALLALIGTYLINMDTEERRKRAQWVKKEIALETRVGLNNLKLNLIVAPIAVVAMVIIYLIARSNMAEYGIWIVLGPMLISLVFTLIIVIPRRNNPNYQVYYLFHPTRFVKLGILAGIIFMALVYFIAQCGSSYGLPLGVECISTIIVMPLSFFGF